MTRGVQKTIAWSGVGFMLLLLAGALMAGLLPPMTPTRTAEQVAEFWATNTGLKRCGLVILLPGAALQVTFGALIAARIRAMEGRFTPFAYIQIICAGLAMVATILPVFAFAVASYRPERDPQITQAFNDLGWLAFVMNWPAASLSCLVIGLAIFGYRGPRPTWPRWLAYFNLWTGFLFAAGGLAVLFKTGVFAWDGLLAFWLALVVFGGWCGVMTWQLLASIPEESALSDGDLDNAFRASAVPAHDI